LGIELKVVISSIAASHSLFGSKRNAGKRTLRKVVEVPVNDTV